MLDNFDLPYSPMPDALPQSPLMDPLAKKKRQEQQLLFGAPKGADPLAGIGGPPPLPPQGQPAAPQGQAPQAPDFVSFMRPDTSEIEGKMASTQALAAAMGNMPKIDMPQNMPVMPRASALQGIAQVAPMLAQAGLGAYGASQGADLAKMKTGAANNAMKAYMANAGQMDPKMLAALMGA